ncbi:hypothetical protein [Streptomyces sp. NPDC054842]
MPGQRKRKRRRQDETRRATARTAPGSGHWEVLFETQDESEWRAHLRRLRSADSSFDWSLTRIDTLCGRLVQPTTYRLSLFVPAPERHPSRDHLHQ